jgi:hypothetical protein
LLNLSNGLVDTSTITQAGRTIGLPLETIRIDEPTVHQIYESSLVLVRPDGHVAWRGDAMPSDAFEIINKVRGTD